MGRSREAREGRTAHEEEVEVGVDGQNRFGRRRADLALLAEQSWSWLALLDRRGELDAFVLTSPRYELDDERPVDA